VILEFCRDGNILDYIKVRRNYFLNDLNNEINPEESRTAIDVIKSCNTFTLYSTLYR